jgi:hypothetical protein
MASREDMSRVVDIPIGTLKLDASNPRFAGELGAQPSQSRILDYIADAIGVGDLLSSMSSSGYYKSHPLLAVRENQELVVVEGNRRLAAALMLMDDERASNQRSRVRSYDIKPAAKKSLEQLPVLIAPGRVEVLPYIGIAHIVGNKKWDSYAKAAWAADVLEKNIYEGGIRAIAAEIGDKHRTLQRLVEAFRLVKQLESAARFFPNDTIRRGKGVARYPFSWVYTALGYQSVREWLGIAQDDSTSKEIIPNDKLDRAAELLTWLFGNRSRDQKPVIDDSRQISDLAASLLVERRVAVLRKGDSLEVAIEESQPPNERIADGLLAAERALKDVLGIIGIAGAELRLADLSSLAVDARRVANAASNAVRGINALSERHYEQIAE